MSIANLFASEGGGEAVERLLDEGASDALLVVLWRTGPVRGRGGL